MNALDSLKMDMDDYNEVLASDMKFLFWKIADLYKNYSKMDLNEITTMIVVIYDEINQIGKVNAALRKMEEYYILFKQEQGNATDDLDFCKWEKRNL